MMADTETADPQSLVDAIPDLIEYGRATLNSNGTITLPKTAKTDARLLESEHYNVYGSPSLGMLILTGQRRSASELLLFTLQAGVVRP